MRIAALGLLAALAAAASAAERAAAADPAAAIQKNGQKNIVLIVADDMGLQMGCYGDRAARTPNLDRLAAEGARFTRAFCTTASCSASRSVILSGQLNHANGQYGHAHDYHHFASFDRVKSLPVVLAAGGYRTCSIGKYHVGPESVYHFERYENRKNQADRNGVQMAENARRFIAADDPRPFFLYFCSADPHRGRGPGGFSNFSDNAGYYPGHRPIRFDPATLPLPPWLCDNADTRAEWAEYYQAVARLDEGIGRLLEVLQQTRHWEDTLVVFVSDNGPPFPGAKTNLYEPGMRLPLLVRHPQRGRGRVSEAMVTWADLMPTLLDYAGVACPKGHDLHGRSFLAALDGDTGPAEVYASHTFHEITMYYPMRVVRTARYKYILNLASGLPYPFASDLHESAAWQSALRSADGRLGRRSIAAYVQRPRHELYDLESDPDEVKNLADDPRHAAALAALQAKLKAWQQSTRDPWLLKYEYE